MRSTRTLAALAALAVLGSCNCGPRTNQTRPELEVHPQTLDFGQVPFGGAKELTLTLVNVGSSLAVVSSISLTGQDGAAFRTSGVQSLSVPAGGSLDLRVTFEPTRVGAAAARLAIDSDAVNAPQLLVPLVGEGVADLADAGGSDAGGMDAGMDAGAPDAGFDAGVMDAGETDAGFDAGAPDAGMDAGAPDAGFDAGVAVDAGCPSDMATVAGGGCVDRYEASQGGGGEAVSAALATPWVSLTTAQAETACQLAGKHLCTEAEWQAACQGPSGYIYPYGDTYQSQTCNGLDKGLGAIVATGSVATCEGGYPGVYDMSGNAYERTIGPVAGTPRIKGGSYRSAFGAGLLKCTSGFDFGATGDPAVGFRCCR